MRNVLLLLLTIVISTMASAIAVAAPTRTSCTPGVHPFGDVSARTFCGPAKATLVVGGRTIRYHGGSCERGPAYVSVNIGTVVLGLTTKLRPEYFGLNVGKVPLFGGAPAAHDGTFPAGAIAARHAGKGYAIMRGTVTRAGGRTRGTFAGTLLGGGAATGSFQC